MSPQWMNSDGDEVWHEIAPDTLRTGRCTEIVRGVVHQRRTVPMDGELCAACMVSRGVIEMVPRPVESGVLSVALRMASVLVWPDADPDDTAAMPCVADGLAALGVPVTA